MTSLEKFNAAVNVVKNLPQNGPFEPSNQLKLKFYKYFKQATEGPCKKPSPSIFDPVGKMKWKAWKHLGNMSKSDAMEAYVTELMSIVETMSYTENVESFLESLESFPNEELEIALGPVLSRAKLRNSQRLESDLPNFHDESTSNGQAAASVESFSDGEFVDSLTDLEDSYGARLSSEEIKANNVTLSYSRPVEIELKNENLTPRVNYTSEATIRDVDWAVIVADLKTDLETMKNNYMRLEEALSEVQGSVYNFRIGTFIAGGFLSFGIIAVLGILYQQRRKY